MPAQPFRKGNFWKEKVLKLYSLRVEAALVAPPDALFCACHCAHVANTYALL